MIEETLDPLNMYVNFISLKVESVRNGIEEEPKRFPVICMSEKSKWSKRIIKLDARLY